MKKLIEPLIVLVILVFVYASPSMMFDHKAIFALLSPGAHTSSFDLVFFLLFLLCRLAVIFLLVPYFLVRLLIFTYGYLKKASH